MGITIYTVILINTKINIFKTLGCCIIYLFLIVCTFLFCLLMFITYFYTTITKNKIIFVWFRVIKDISSLNTTEKYLTVAKKYVILF